MDRRMNLDYFKPEEFERGGVNWFTLTSPELLYKLDVVRLMSGHSVVISPHPDAVGRMIHEGEGYNSQHNFVRWDEVRAVDVFPMITYHRKNSIFFMVDAFYDNCRNAGFRGIGIYPDRTLNGKKRIMFHLDVDEDAEMNNPDEWGHLKSEGFVAIDKAFQYIEENLNTYEI